MKKLVNLKGAKALNKNEQKSINGGAPPGTCCDPTNDCCTTNPPPVSCNGWGNSNCQYLFTNRNPGYPYQNCCI